MRGGFLGGINDFLKKLCEAFKCCLEERLQERQGEEAASLAFCVCFLSVETSAASHFCEPGNAPFTCSDQTSVSL